MQLKQLQPATSARSRRSHSSQHRQPHARGQADTGVTIIPLSASDGRYDCVAAGAPRTDRLRAGSEPEMVATRRAHLAESRLIAAQEHALASGPFVRLSEDLLFAVLSFCDGATLGRLERTCRLFAGRKLELRRRFSHLRFSRIQIQGT